MLGVINEQQEDFTRLDFSENIKTETEAIRKVRIGQNFFRKTILAPYNYRCCITGNPIPLLLTASHILPWSQFPEQRLNPHNGLCLARTHDTAFDQGLISFDEDLRLIIGHEIEKKAQDQGSETLELNFINYRGKILNVPDRFSPDLDFLNYHRYHIWFFRTYTVENSPSSLSVQQCSKVDKYQSNKNSKPYCTSFTSMSC
ncbi:HNH endonuclease [Microcystis aeruginosa]|uniref:HNH endonuclease n=1 Tax=Microcystis aeruginosa TaxID=1126 RepID=UPI002AD464A1|nr:HNH endonuclease [Microcystis aeruginosa]